MTRHIDSKFAIQTAATAPGSIVSNITVSSPDSQPSLANILLRPFRRAQITRELQGLDERMLRDIGVTKSEIDRVAADSVGGEEWVVVAVAKYLGRKLAAWSSRRDAFRRLMALDDRMLADIGLNRTQIPEVVKAMRYTPAGSVEGSFESEVVLPLKQWNLWRDAHKQLSQLDNRMLSDIGLVRGDIDWVAEELAGRAVRKPANANATAPHKAA
jgi:uncharacterized protein YjiS (DUF1127 family)